MPGIAMLRLNLGPSWTETEYYKVYRGDVLLGFNNHICVKGVTTMVETLLIVVCGWK